MWAVVEKTNREVLCWQAKMARKYHGIDFVEIMRIEAGYGLSFNLLWGFN